MKNKLTDTILILFTITLGISGTVIFYEITKANSCQDIVATTEVTHTKLPATVYIDNDVEVVKEIEVIREVPVVKVVEVFRSQYFREWTSLEHFTTWYHEQGFTALMPNGGDLETADCDDYAWLLSSKAVEQGYLVSYILVDETGSVYGVPMGKPNHMANMIVVGNGVYYVEPNIHEFNVIYLCNLDTEESYNRRLQ